MTEENRRNYYRILHVQPDAPTEVIKSSYRTLMQRLRMHPDLGGDHWNAALINEAYAVLTDPEQRAEYDRQLPLFEREDQDAEDRPEPAIDPAARPAGAGGSPYQCPFCRAGYASKAVDETVCQSCGSPLARPGGESSRAAWIRATERMPQDLPLRFWTGWPNAPALDGTLVDLSLTGLRFNTSQALLRDQFLKVDCDRFQAIARVIHCQPRGREYQVGAEFLTLRFARSKGAFVSDRV
ncbi:MAG: DnaJ domain-containing protein [Gammaproteobacteria bacterium]|nr:DnaJ domain-containing protein [Gammaproteobacteria bacterium]